VKGVAAMKNFRDLLVWEKAHLLTLNSYRLTNAFPRQELFGLTSQIRRAAASIAANIAEGCGKRGNGEFQRFLNIASGSASELEYHFLLAHDLQLLDQEAYTHLNASVVEVKRMLSALARKVDTERLAG
jgi:four helix bundle protein